MNTYQLSCKNGNFLLLKDDFISNCMAYYGEWAEKEVALFSSLLKKGDCVIEVGSNIGTHAVPIANLIGENGKLYCIEAQRLIFQILNANLALNNLSNVHSICAIAAEQSGATCLREDEFEIKHNKGAFSVPANANQTIGEFTFVITIDDLVSSYKLDKLNFLKIDVEGMEENVLKGAQKCITKFKPVIFFECSTSQNPALYQKGDQINNWLKDFSYKLFWYNCLGYNPDNYRACKENRVGPSGDFNILAVPNDVNLPISLKEVISVSEIAGENKFWI